jgi:hypothetical protein
MAAYAGGHITWGPAGAPGEQQHFAIAGPDLKLFWDQSPDRGESNSRGFAEPVENFTFVGCVRALDSLRPRIVRSTLTCCRLSRVNQSVKNARCIAWAPAERPAGLLAAGLATGRILLANFRGRWSMEDCDTMELWNGTRGAVNSLAWHPAVPGRLAGGLDRKQRDDGSVLVWDVSRPDWQWISAPDDTELWSNPIVASRSRGSMERLAALGASAAGGSGSGDRLTDAATGALTGSVTHSSSGLSAGSGQSRGSESERSGSDRMSGGRVSSGEQLDASSSTGGPLVNALRRDMSGMSSFTTSSQSSASDHMATPFGEGASVYADMGENEQSQSVGWLPDQPTCLAVGTSLQWLHVYDLRVQSRKAVLSVAAHAGTKVRGVRVAPTSPHHIATFEKPDQVGAGGGASVVKLWDSRRLEAPLLSWAVGAPLVDVAWVPSAERDGNLATLVSGGQSTDAGAILLWSTLGATDMVQREVDDQHDAGNSNQRIVPPAPPMIPTPARTIRIAGSHPPAAFAWHPKLPRALVLAEDGQIAMMTLRPPTAVAWHGESLAIGFGAKLGAAHVGITDSDSVETTMRSRVEAGYAMSAKQNAEITAPSAADIGGGAATRPLLDRCGVHFAWQWVDHMERLSESNMLGKRLDGGKRGDKDDHPYHGVRQAIPRGASGRELGSETYTLVVNGLEGTVYGGHARQLAMRLCAWEGIAGQVNSATCGQDPEAQEAHLLRLEGEEHHTRAAALAIFALDIRRAVLALQRAVSVRRLDRIADGASGEANRWLRLAALALGGYSPGREKEWGQTCLDLGILTAPHGGSGTPEHQQTQQQTQQDEDPAPPAVADPYLRAAFVFLACHATRASSGSTVGGSGGKTEGSLTPSSVQSGALTQESYLNQPDSPGGFSADGSVHRYPALGQTSTSGADGGSTGGGSSVGTGLSGGAGGGEPRFLYKRSLFAPVLEVDGLTRYDAIAFACRFLEDEALVSYLDSMESEAIAAGSLEGLLLLGLTEKALPLLQAYVDTTADVQTAALLLAFVAPRRFKCAQASNWMTTYRDLLDRWRLYHQRCLLDICIVPYSGVKVPPQTYATCQVSSLPNHPPVSAKPSRSG